MNLGWLISKCQCIVKIMPNAQSGCSDSAASWILSEFNKTFISAVKMVDTSGTVNAKALAKLTRGWFGSSDATPISLCIDLFTLSIIIFNGSSISLYLNSKGLSWPEKIQLNKWGLLRCFYSIVPLEIIFVQIYLCGIKCIKSNIENSWLENNQTRRFMKWMGRMRTKIDQAFSMVGSAIAAAEMSWIFYSIIFIFIALYPIALNPNASACSCFHLIGNENKWRLRATKPLRI